MDKEEIFSKKLWETNRRNPSETHEALINLLEMRKRREDWGELDFSDMNLQSFSMVKYFKGQFKHRDNTNKTRISLATFKGVGHSGSVTSIGVLDENRIVAGSKDGTIHVWNRNTGDCIKTLDGHDGSITCISIKKPNLIISGSSDGSIRIWDLDSQSSSIISGFDTKLVSATLCHDGSVIGASYSYYSFYHYVSRTLGNIMKWKNGSIEWNRNIHVYGIATISNADIVIAYLGNTIKLINGKDGNIIKEVSFHEYNEFHEYINCMCCFESDKMIAGTSKGKIQIIDTVKFELQDEYQFHSDSVCCIAVNKDGIVLSASNDNTLSLFDLPNQRQIQSIPSGKIDTTCACVLSDHEFVVGASDGSINVFHLGGALENIVCKYQSTIVSSICRYKDNKMLLGLNDGRICIWDIATNQCIKVIHKHSSSITGLLFLGNKYCVSSSMDGFAYLWEVENREISRELCYSKLGITSIAFNNDSLLLIDCLLSINTSGWEPDYHHKIIVIETSNWICVSSEFYSSCWQSGKLDSNNNYLYLSYGKPYMAPHYIYSIVHLNFDNTPLHYSYQDSYPEDKTLPPMGYAALALYVLDEEEIVISTGESLQIWNSVNHCRKKEIPAKVIRHITKTKDGRIIGGGDSIIVWKPITGEVSILIDDHAGCTCIAMLDDRYLVSGTTNSTYQVWDTETGSCIFNIPLCEIDVTDMDFRDAILDKETAKLLYCNGARIPERDHLMFDQELSLLHTILGLIPNH